jgi:hypothetical protein
VEHLVIWMIDSYTELPLNLLLKKPYFLLDLIDLSSDQESTSTFDPPIYSFRTNRFS